MTATPAVTDRTGASDQEFADRVAAFEGAPAAPESFDPIAALRRVEALAEEWRYKGEFGWGPWQRGEGPDIEGQVLDEAATRIRAALAPQAAR